MDPIQYFPSATTEWTTAAAIGTLRAMPDHHLTFILRPSDSPRWLTLVDQYSKPIRAQRLEPGADLAVAYDAGKAALTVEGYEMESDVGLGFCFAVRGTQKVQLVLQVIEPGQMVTGHGASIG
jgi:hypothetical protein